MLVTVMLAPGTAAPVESSTLPETDAVTCARIVPAAKQMQNKTPAKTCVDDLPSESILHLPAFVGIFGDYTPHNALTSKRGNCPDSFQGKHSHGFAGCYEVLRDAK